MSSFSPIALHRKSQLLAKKMNLKMRILHNTINTAIIWCRVIKASRYRESQNRNNLYIVLAGSDLLTDKVIESAVVHLVHSFKNAELIILRYGYGPLATLQRIERGSITKARNLRDMHKFLAEHQTSIIHSLMTFGILYKYRYEYCAFNFFKNSAD